MISFMNKYLLPEDKWINLKLYFKYMHQYEQYIDRNDKMDTNVDLFQFSEFKRDYFLDEVYLNENLKLFENYQFFGFVIKEQGLRKKIALISKNFEKHKNVFFFNMGF